MNWKDEVVMITGASSGLGRALAIRAGQLGATSILIARDEKKLYEVCKQVPNSYGFPFDLENVEEIPTLYDEITQNFKEIPYLFGVDKKPTILFNCVGYQVMGFVVKTPIEEYEKNYKVNTIAPVALIQCVLPGMIQQNKGVIANVYSSIMYHSFPCVSSYCASKKALQAIHESLKAEIHGLPIKMMSIRPGAMKTNYWKNTHNLIKGHTVPVAGGNDPSIVAKKIFEAIEQGKENFDLSTFKDKIGYHLSYWLPNVLDKMLVKRNIDKIAKLNEVIYDGK